MVVISRQQYEEACKVPSNNKPILLLVRGLQGSGKSSYARSVCKSYNHVEADMFFMRSGEYVFEPGKIEEAHRWCFGETETYLQMNRNVVVTNTFVRAWEMEPYINLARRMEVRFHISCMNEFDSKSLSESNKHNVSFDTIEKKRKAFCFPYEGVVSIKGEKGPIRFSELYYPIVDFDKKNEKQLIINPFRYARISKEDWNWKP